MYKPPSSILKSLLALRGGQGVLCATYIPSVHMCIPLHMFSHCTHSLTGNGIGDTGARYLQEAIRNCPTLEKL